MIPFDSEDLVRHLIELLKLAFSQQMAQVLDILRFLKRTGDRQFLLFFLNVIAVVIPDRYVLALQLQLSSISCKLISDRLFRK